MLQMPLYVLGADKLDAREVTVGDGCCFWRRAKLSERRVETPYEPILSKLSLS